MASMIKYLARWLAWQVADHQVYDSPGPARITVFSADERRLSA
jgi:hypothetical protein